MPSPIPTLLDDRMTSLTESLRPLRDSWRRRIIEDWASAWLEGLPARCVSDALRLIQAHEGSIWLHREEEDVLIPCWNNGPQAGEFVGRFRLPRREGLTGLAFSGNLGLCESEVCFHQAQNRLLDEKLGVLTWAMLAVPFQVAGQTCGTLTAVRLIPLRDLGPLTALPRSRADFPAGYAPPPSFQIEDLAQMEVAAATLGRLLEHRLHAWILNLEE